MPSVWETSTFKETYWVNTTNYNPAQGGLRVQTFCHSFLLPDWKSSPQPHPVIMASLILSGVDVVATGEGDIIRRKPGWFKIADLNTVSGSRDLRTDTLERYFILLEINPLLRGILAQLFPDGLPGFAASSPERLKQNFEAVRDALEPDGRPDETRTGGRMFQLLLEAARQVPHFPRPSALTMAQRYIDNHFCEAGLDRCRIAAASGVSISLLGKLFRRHLDTTVQEYVATLRLEKVKRMLTFSGDSVSEIAESSGFTYSYYLAREFKKRFGMTPLKYREQTRCLTPLS